MLNNLERMDILKIIDKYYKENVALRDILLIHSRAVTKRALIIAEHHPELNLDKDFISEAAMLHDIGIVCCNAPAIHCFGTEPYIRHGLAGAEMLRREGLERHARVCERHTGAGLPLDEIIDQNLPLPHRDFQPETLEEQVICYADKFYSKTLLEHEKTLEEAERSLMKFGMAGVERFRHWAELFE